MLVRLDSGNVNSDKLGNKGKFLGLMRQKGFNVPAGFVLDSDTYDETVSGTAGEVIRNTLSCLNKDNVSDTEILLKELFADMRLPESVREELKGCEDIIRELPFDLSPLLDRHPYDPGRPLRQRRERRQYSKSGNQFR